MITILSRYCLLFIAIFSINTSSGPLLGMENARRVLLKRNDAANNQIKGAQKKVEKLQKQEAHVREKINELKLTNEVHAVQIDAFKQKVKQQELRVKSKKLRKEDSKLTEEERLEKIEFRMKILYYLPVIYLNLCTLSAIYNFNIEPTFIMFYIVTYLVDQVSFSSDVPKFLAQTWVNVIPGKNPEDDLTHFVGNQQVLLSDEEESEEEQLCDEPQVFGRPVVQAPDVALTPEQRALAERLRRLFINPEYQPAD